MIKTADIKKLATLARIEVDDAEAEGLAKDVEGILGYVQQVQSMPIAHRKENENGLVNIMREDARAHEPSAHTEKLLAIAPMREGTYLKVKPIL